MSKQAKSKMSGGECSNEAQLVQIDRYQARGNMLAQLGRVLTQEEQDSARDEVLAYKF